MRFNCGCLTHQAAALRSRSLWALVHNASARLAQAVQRSSGGSDPTCAASTSSAAFCSAAMALTHAMTPSRDPHLRARRPTTPSFLAPQPPRLGAPTALHSTPTSALAPTSAASAGALRRPFATLTPPLLSPHSQGQKPSHGGGGGVTVIPPYAINNLMPRHVPRSIRAGAAPDDASAHAFAASPETAALIAAEETCSSSSLSEPPPDLAPDGSGNGNGNDAASCGVLTGPDAWNTALARGASIKFSDSPALMLRRRAMLQWTDGGPMQVGAGRVLVSSCWHEPAWACGSCVDLIAAGEAAAGCLCRCLTRRTDGSPLPCRGGQLAAPWVQVLVVKKPGSPAATSRMWEIIQWLTQRGIKVLVERTAQHPQVREPRGAAPRTPVRRVRVCTSSRQLLSATTGHAEGARDVKKCSAS